MKDLLVQIARWFEKQLTIGSPQANILLYHSISSSDTVVDVTRRAFAKQLDALSQTHQFASVDDIVDYIDEKKVIFGKPVVALTFDDGYTNLLKLTPLIKKYNVRPMVFVTAHPELINRQELANKHKVMNEIQVRELISAGWDIGCHTITHPNLLLLSDTELEQEIHDAKRMLEETYGMPVKYFAYPKGFYNERIISIVRNAGYHGAFTTERGLINTRTSRYRIYRLGIDRTVTEKTFPFMLSYSALAYFGLKQVVEATIREVNHIIHSISNRALPARIRVS